MRFSQKIKFVKIKDIYPNPYQIRRSFERKALFELAESIKINGVLSPVILRGSITGYEIICGQRRIRAASIAGLTEVPAIIVRVGDAECAELSMIENIQRENLSIVEEAEGYYNLMAYHRIKKDKLQRNLSVSNERINEKIQLLNLSEAVRYKIEENDISEKYARELLKVHDEKKQLDIIDEIVNAELTYSKLCTKVKNEIAAMIKNEPLKESLQKNIVSFRERLSVYKNTLDKTVEILKKSGAKVKMEEKECDKYSEFVFKIYKN
ncbi:MAG: ParB/RepB/Spo0J family partition protein [Clostridia bacterium]|nr:ParB/RepB/Spo0J family partition protein [Clostridia bacterium]